MLVAAALDGDSGREVLLQFPAPSPSRRRSTPPTASDLKFNAAKSWKPSAPLSPLVGSLTLEASRSTSNSNVRNGWKADEWAR